MASPANGTSNLRFGRRVRHEASGKMPVFVMTGYLGAGKTTLIQSLLNTAEGRNTAIIVNEFGTIGIDQSLLRSSTDTIALLGNGCICCRVRSDLTETVLSLLEARVKGDLPSFDRIIIEASGLADPSAILQTFISDRALRSECHLMAVLAAVDVVMFERTIEVAPEVKKQILLADRVILTKSDLASARELSNVTRTVQALNPTADLCTSDNGRVDPTLVLATQHRSSGLMACDAVDPSHTSEITNFSMTLDRPVVWDAFAQAMETLTALRGPDLLRVKGLVNVEGLPGPVVVHVVQHLSHPPIELTSWPDSDTRTRLVFITRRVPATTIKNVIESIQAAAA